MISSDVSEVEIQELAKVMFSSCSFQQYWLFRSISEDILNLITKKKKNPTHSEFDHAQFKSEYRYRSLNTYGYKNGIVSNP